MKSVGNSIVPDMFGWQPSPSIVPGVYPAAPGYKGAEDGPSHDAAKAIAPSVTRMQRWILDLLEGGEILTADQIAIRLQRSPFSIRPRVAELHALGLLEPDAIRGKNESGMSANRWRVVQ